MESILDSVDKACQNVTCPIIKQRCEWIGKNKEEFTGFVVARTHPVLDGQWASELKERGVAGEVGSGWT